MTLSPAAGSGATVSTGSGSGSGPASAPDSAEASRAPLGSGRAGGESAGAPAASPGEGPEAGSGVDGVGCSSARASCWTVRVTLVPHPEGLMATLPLAPVVSHSTLCSGSTRVIRISPSSPRWRARAVGSLSSAQSSGGDLTSVR